MNGATSRNGSLRSFQLGERLAGGFVNSAVNWPVRPSSHTKICQGHHCTGTPQIQAPPTPGHVQTCSTWTMLYRTPDMYKLIPNKMILKNVWLASRLFAPYWNVILLAHTICRSDYNSTTCETAVLK